MAATLKYLGTHDMPSGTDLSSISIGLVDEGPQVGGVPFEVTDDRAAYLLAKTSLIFEEQIGG
jgi:hypothetical protein